MSDFQEHCTLRPGQSGPGTTRATRVCRSQLGGVDLLQSGPTDRHVRLLEGVHGSMSLIKAALWTQILKEQSHYLALEEGLT